MAVWNINIHKGATYQVTLTIDGVADIGAATEWRLTCAQPNGTVFLTASSIGASPMFVATALAKTKILAIPSATTLTLPQGNGRYDFEVHWTGGVVRRYIANGSVQVTSEVG